MKVKKKETYKEGWELANPVTVWSTHLSLHFDFFHGLFLEFFYLTLFEQGTKPDNSRFL